MGFAKGLNSPLWTLKIILLLVVQCGYIDSGIIPLFSGCDDGVSWFQSNGQWQGRSYEPQAPVLWIFFI